MRTIPLVIIAIVVSVCCNSQILLKDKFGRNLAGHTIILTDWEGYIANPAIGLSVQALGVTYPYNIVLSANGARLYFDMPSLAGATGPAKTITLNDTNAVNFYISVFPDRDSINENYLLTVNSTSGTQNYAVQVVDQDKTNPVMDYNIITDFSKDTTYHFFSNNAYKNRVKQAADDWAYFIANMHLDTVPANNELTYIYEDDYAGGSYVMNATAYNGFLLYPYGIHTTGHHSSGGASTNNFQKMNGVPTQLRRSGAYETEIHGNFNTLGWDTAITDNTWYNATNFGDVANDLYSIALHEMGHALCFYPGYPVFEIYENQGFINDPEVVQYQGSNVPVDYNDHLSNGELEDSLKFVDRMSKKGAFGSEYAAVMPYGRWLITKLNLLCLKAIGYDLKATSAFKAVDFVTPSTLADGTAGQTYNHSIVATGGIPFYKFEITSGTLPGGLSLNGFTGSITGVPTQPGNYSFAISITEYDNKTVIKNFSVNITSQVYTFTGNGNWSDPDNWLNQVVPPATLTTGMEVIINPVAGGQCTYTGNINLLDGGRLTVLAGKKLNIKP